MNNNILISVGILNNLWENKKQDSLDLLLPFLKCSIDRTTAIGQKVDIGKLTEDFKNEYGYHDIPFHVISILLNRLSPVVLKKEKGQYTLIASLENETKLFEKKRTDNKKHCEHVIEELRKHLETAIPKEKFTDEIISERLFSFFSSRGVSIVDNAESLIALKKRDDKTEYEIARFIIQEYHKDSVVFSYIIEMVQGYFVSTALSIPQTSTSLNTKMRGTSCYIDTRIIINALGWHLPEEVKTSSLELITMLKDAGAKLYCFSHNYDEICNVLSAYRASLNGNATSTPTNTLEAFDEANFTVDDVDDVKRLLKGRIEKLGIKFFDVSLYDKGHAKEAYIDFQGLENELKSEMHYNVKSTNSGAFADTNSIAAIMLLRNGKKSSDFEHSEHLFVSSSRKYCEVVNRFLNIDPSETVSPVIPEVDLAALLWLRNYKTHQDYPKKKLIENAMTILEVPSPHFVSDLFNEIDKIKLSGVLNEDEAMVLRQDHYTRRELYKAARGDSNAINEDSILKARDTLKQKYIKDEAKKAELNLKAYESQKQENNDIKSRALKEINKTGIESYDSMKNFLTVVSKVLFWCILAAGIVMMILGFKEKNSGTIIISAFLLFVDIAAFIDFVVTKKKLIDRVIERISIHFSDCKQDRKRDEYRRIIGDF